MKYIAYISFGISTGAISAVCGFNVIENPWQYIMVNFPLIVCFVVCVNLFSIKKLD